MRGANTCHLPTHPEASQLPASSRADRRQPAAAPPLIKPCPAALSRGGRWVPPRFARAGKGGIARLTRLVCGGGGDWEGLEEPWPWGEVWFEGVAEPACNKHGKKINRRVLPPFATGLGRAGRYFPLALLPQETGTGMSGISVLLG